MDLALDHIQNRIHDPKCFFATDPKRANFALWQRC